MKLRVIESICLVAAAAALIAVVPFANALADDEPVFAVRAIFNEGLTTAHKKCSQADFHHIKATILAATKEHRKLRGDARELITVNCGKLCDMYRKNVCIAISYGRCTGAESESDDFFSRRDLSAAAKVDYVILDYENDIIINNKNNNNKYMDDPQDEQRQLVPANNNKKRNGFTEAVCNENKAMLYQIVLSTLGHVDTACANLLLSPSFLQCIAIG